MREVKLNTHAAAINGDGGDLGWNAALMHVAGPWSFGASYRSAVTVAMDGKIDSPQVKSDISADLNLPWMAQIGVRYQATDNLGVEFDIERTGWKKFNQILVNSNANGAILVNNTNGWKSSNAYRLGITYDLNSGTQLRAGYARDLTGQGDDRFTARVPDADRNLFSVGLKQKLANDWAVEAAYMYVKFDDRDYASTVPFGTYGTDPNGTSVYNGKYQSNAHLFGLGVTKKF
ncbi:MAG: porin [Gammaproteobacteria bacterium]|nr:porin [Gammaproteobacteria bacterium]